jgi:subtilase family serine protease
VSFVTGLVGMPVERLGRMRVSSPAADLVVVPQTLLGIYNLTGVTGNAQSTQAPAEFQSYQSYRPVDLNKFITQTAVTNFTVANKVGPFQPSSGALESALDIQYIGAVGVGNTNWYWTETQWMYDFASTITTSGTATPNIFSMSWGWNEQDQCQVGSDGPCGSGGTSYQYVAAVNALFAKAGAAGLTILAASGDSGAHGRTDPTCQSAVTRPDYPAASQYVTTVGATQLINGVQGGNSPICSTGGAYAGQCAIGGTEVVCSPATGALISSGGGFSNVAAMPSWAQTAQKAYQAISGACPPAADYNASGSGYPDVAALGHNYYIQAGGAVLVDGTSCSSPVFAGILGLINAQLLAAGKSKLGFFNPLLYQIGAKYPNAFNDITVGNNYCTEESCSCTTGYKATTGWDATTGWGTPNYPNLLAAVKAIGAEREMRLKH